MTQRPSRRRFLSTGATAALALGAGRGAVIPRDDPITRLLPLEMRLAHWIRQERESILQAPPDGPGNAVPWADYGFKWPAYTLAHLLVRIQRRPYFDRCTLRLKKAPDSSSGRGPEDTLFGPNFGTRNGLLWVGRYHATYAISLVSAVR